DEILEIDPNNTDALGNKANVMSKRGKFDDALKYIDRSLRINNKSIETWKNKAELLRWLGDSEGAKKSDEEADRLESNL
ncbi:MAG: tetratricopeptide repeat protein, partial [Nitrososphaeraceae archaeon]|nr:tetratricopeptide repeat protein [Nitrososphaeraceae archaeon]